MATTEIPPVLVESEPYLSILSSFNYEQQNTAVSSVLSSLSPFPSPLFSSRFTLRAMTPEDIPTCAHLIGHSFGSQGLFNQALRLPINSRLNDWIARLRVCLCDHLCFVIEDNQFQEQRYKYENLFGNSSSNSSNSENNEWCQCHTLTPINIYPPSSSPSSKIVACLVAHDLTSRVSTLTPSPPHFISRAIISFLHSLGSKRIDRVREEENLLLSIEEIKESEEREEKEKEKQEVISKETPHHFEKERDNKKDNEKTIPKSGEGLEVWILATRHSHQGFKLASFLSQFFVEFVKRETKYKFITVDSAHPATEKIWKGEKINARVMSRMKTKEFEFKDEEGKIKRPLSMLDYDMCTMDVDIKRS